MAYDLLTKKGMLVDGTGAPPKRSPWSEGLIGEASMRTMTSSGFGSGVATLMSERSRMPPLFSAGLSLV